MPDLAAYLDELCERTRNGWAANPDLVQVDARREAALLSTGHADRQVAELVQNAVDAAAARRGALLAVRLGTDLVSWPSLAAALARFAAATVRGNGPRAGRSWQMPSHPRLASPLG
ncbi:MAG: hypothetical protein NZ523_12995 [Elioraea sp.]|nr:hypothetical protein [Elioraea sp.]